MRKPTNGVKNLIDQGRMAFGTFVYSPDPAMTELIADAGFDFVIIDTEHASIDRKDIEQLTRAAAVGGATAFVRIEEQDPRLVGQALDAGAAGVVIPHLSDPSVAAEMVRAAIFPPRGTRGACTTSRATAYSTWPFDDYVVRADTDAWVIGQIEDPEGVARVDEIVAAGVHALMPGPSDLAAALEVPGQFHHPRVLEAVDRILRSGRGTLPTLMYVNEPSEAQAWVDRGVRLVVYSIDYKVAAKSFMAAMRVFERLQPAVPQRAGG